MVIVLETEKYNFRDASCCKVDVVNGGAGDLLAGFLVKSEILYEAPTFFLRNALASSSVLKFLGNFALNLLPSSVINSASTRNEPVVSKFSISRSRSTIKRTATDCTRPAERPPLTFFHNTGESSYPTNRSKMRRACWAFTRL